MSVTDPIADMLTRIRNGNSVNKESVEVPYSNMKRSILDLLKSEGFIRHYEVIDNGTMRMLKIFLKYGANREHVITGIRRISKPGLRVYVGSSDIPKVLGGLGMAVISTSKGILTDKEARRLGVGGEVICYVW